MDLDRPLPVHKTAWLSLTLLIFLAGFWWLQPIFLATFSADKVWLWLPCTAAVTLANALVLGWVAQFLWGFIARPFSKEKKRPMPAAHWLLLGGMAFLSPLLADCVHSGVVVSHGIRFYNAELSLFFSTNYWGYVAVRTLIVFLICLPFARTPLRHRVVWAGSVALWIFFDYASETVYK